MSVKIPSQELVPTDSLKTDGQNPNKLTIKEMDRLMQSIRKWGFLIPIVTNRELLIADGEHKWEAAKRLEMKEVPVIRLDVGEVDRRLLRQVLNKLRGTHEPLGDAQEFKRIIDGKGESDLKVLLDLSTKELNHYLDLIQSGVGLPSKPVEKTDILRGDIFTCGSNRLMCGDSLNMEDVAKLVGSDRVDMLFLDPPFGLEVSPEVLDFWLGLANVTFYLNSDREVMKAHSHPLFRYLLVGTSTYASVNNPSMPLQHHTLMGVFYRENPFQRIYPPFSSVITYFKPHSNGYQKNPYFLERLLHAYTQKEQTVLDLFAGWGNMLNVCAENGRRYLGMELNPLQAQLIIDSYKGRSGENFVKATLAA